jgi:hypothetical protein
MKNVPVIPETYEQDYPHKVFRFTGEWSRQPKYSSRRVARRNNPSVWLPIFKADDGETICLSWLKSEICPTMRAVDPPSAVESGGDSENTACK